MSDTSRIFIAVPIAGQAANNMMDAHRKQAAKAVASVVTLPTGGARRKPATT